MRLLRRHIPLLLLVVTVIAIQLLTSWSGTQYYLTPLTMSGYYSLVIIGLCLLMGYAGQLSLGHAGFFAIGGYVAAALTTHNLENFTSNPLVRFLEQLHVLRAGQDLYGDSLVTVHPWFACLTAVIAAVLIALAIGGPVLRLKGHYLAMATLGFGIIIFRIVMATEYFGEADGISEVPAFPLPGGLSISGDFNARVENYYFAWGLVALGLLLLVNLVHSRVGRALRAIHGSEEAARAMGVDASRYKLLCFVISALFAALAGVLLTHYNGSIGPSESSVMKSVRYVAIIAVGGMSSLWGSLLMGVLLNFMSLRGMFGAYDDAVFGAILIGIMLFAPDGILFHLRRRLGRWPFWK